MNILLVNDDGYSAPGIKILAKALMELGHSIKVVAPLTNFSGASHSMTFFRFYYIKKQDGFDYPCYSVEGSPSDAVKFGIELFENRHPDFVISGINDVANIGSDVVYSGTTNAAVEGAMNGIPSIALSSEIESENDLYFIAGIVKSNLERYYNMAKSNLALNINFNPKSTSNNKHAVCHLGIRRFTDIFVKGENNGARGDLYALTGDPIPLDNDSNSDVEMYAKGYTTITPIIWDMTDYKQVENLKKLTNGGLW